VPFRRLTCSPIKVMAFDACSACSNLVERCPNRSASEHAEFAALPAEVPVMFRPLLFNSISMSFFLVYDLPVQQREPCVQILNRMLENKQLKHTIGATFSLQQTAEAHQTVEAGQTIGNVLIEVDH
jgi:NADPH:quinone reductase-like Zn-dependent oxidoreductase